MFVGTLPILIKFGAKLRKELKYAGQPSRLIHVPLAAVVLPSANDLDASKNNFEFSIRTGFSSVCIFIRVSLLKSYSEFGAVVPFWRYCVRIKLRLPPIIRSNHLRLLSQRLFRHGSYPILPLRIE